MRTVAAASLIALLFAAFLLGHRAAPVDFTIPEPLPEILRDTKHLEPAAFEIEQPLAEWDHLTPPAAPTVRLVAQATPPPTFSRPKSIATDRERKPTIPVSRPRVSFVSNLDFDAVPTGHLSQLNWHAGETLHGAAIPTPVLVAQGETDGGTLCVTAAVHGDELNGIESVRELMYGINTSRLSGRVIGVPIVNLQGFQRHSRYLSDRRDLNRFFPGNPRGSVASRMAHSFFNDIIRHCDYLVDLHTGSFHRTNLPQLRANLHNPGVLALTEGFGATTILHSEGGIGTLRRAAVDAGIPAVTLEAGEPLRLEEAAVEHTVKALYTLMNTLGMYPKLSLWGNPAPTYYSSHWVRAEQGGMLFSRVKLGRKVREGDVLGTVTDPINNEQTEVLAPFSARVIGMAVNQFVMPGYATFHLAAEADIDDVIEVEPGHESGVEVAVADTAGNERSE